MTEIKKLKQQNKKMLEILKRIHKDIVNTDLDHRYLTHGEKSKMIKDCIEEVE